MNIDNYKLNNHGWLILNKPLGITCTRAGSVVKRVFQQKKVGHAGTLDPFACGVLPLALGEATKTIPYLMSDTKTYKFAVSFGSLTSTGDREGEVIATSCHRPTALDIKNILPEFMGKIKQIPPIHSAIKIGGKPAYARARAGEEVVMKPRIIDIYSLTFEDYDGDVAVFTVDCSTGTYVRSLGQDIAHALGTVGHLAYLQRTRVGSFTIDRAVPLEEIQRMALGVNCISLLPIAAVLTDIPTIEVSHNDVIKIRSGHAIPMDKDDCLKMSVLSHGAIVAIGFVEGGFFRPERVFAG